MAKSPPTVLSVLRARVGRAQLVGGIGVLAAVCGAVIASPFAVELMRWAQDSSHPWLVAIAHAVLSRLWVYLVLPLLWLGVSRIVTDLRPWPTAIVSALAGEAVYLALDWFGGTLAMLAHYPSVTIPRVLTLVLGMALSALAIRRRSA